jgi:hypothetical protein
MMINTQYVLPQQMRCAPVQQRKVEGGELLLFLTTTMTNAILLSRDADTYAKSSGVCPVFCVHAFTATRADTNRCRHACRACPPQRRCCTPCTDAAVACQHDGVVHELDKLEHMSL